MERPSSTFRKEEFVPEKQTVNDTFYKQVIKRLIARVHRVRPEFQESGTWYAPTHSLGVVSQFLVKEGIPLLSHPPYYPALALTDFLFPRLKNNKRGDLKL
jgi:hypothetical protein